MYKEDVEEVILKSNQIVKYKCVSYHRMRKPTKHKSIWMVNKMKEIELFKETIDNDYLLNNSGFNVDVLENSKLNTLGKDLSPQRLVIAKYKVDCKNESHGYPVNHTGEQADRPNDEILEKLAASKGMNLSDVTRIKRAKPL